MSLALITKDEDTTYYQPAEVTAYNDTCVFFTTPENNIYYIEKGDAHYSDDMLYLLHMDDMGTEDVDDDKIIVAWQCVE